MRYLIAIVLVIILIVLIYNYEGFSSKKIDCVNCAYNKLSDCTECDTCGVCELDQKSICINGNKNGPIYQDDCITYKYKNNPTLTNKDGPILSLFSKLHHDKNKSQLLNATTSNATTSNATTSNATTSNATTSNATTIPKKDDVLQKELNDYANVTNNTYNSQLVLTTDEDIKIENKNKNKNKSKIDNTGGLGSGILAIIIVSGMIGFSLILILLFYVKNKNEK
jgi:hypothetical protein